MPNDSDPQLRIRMYNIGFGDCFLLYIPDGDDTRLMLVDFGRHLSSKDGNPLSKVCTDLTTEANAIHDRPCFDVIVATHRHYDHIAGFDLSKAKQFEAGEVWLPWTENPDDPIATALKEKQFEFAHALDRVLPADDPNRSFLLNSLSNQGAMDNLTGGFSNQAMKRWLPERDQSPSFTSPSLPGVKVHALGPSHDEKIITTLKPPKGEYYEVVSGAFGPTTGRRPIFGAEHRLTEGEYRTRRVSQHLYEEVAFDELRARAQLDTGLAAQTLEDMINGTSLVLILEIGDAVVVLGGDAEWGTWSEILNNTEWTTLLNKTTVYKVSHHGSYNGTPRRYVQDHMPPDAISLVSLTPMEKWPSIPRQSLLEDLQTGDRQLIRTDQPSPAGGAVTTVTDLYTDITVSI
jgi:beta-lactamase superfamily II metal-dependent hydrolase